MLLKTPRFTPTGVGTTLGGISFKEWSAVHPHGRGDYLPQSVSSRAPCGSPPRAWGLRIGCIRCGRRVRFTPTGVGTTRRVVLPAPFGPVHPHGRGDYDQVLLIPLCYDGSPPRAWGLLRNRVDRSPSGRFTPTGVGTTSGTASTITFSSVHPHGRGDYGAEETLYQRGNGSPPRAWGLPGEQKRPSRPLRFTPTGVGTTEAHYYKVMKTTVHPHGRGDYLLTGGLFDHLFGSPPRAWGLQTESQAENLPGRFTPTGVGTTI